MSTFKSKRRVIFQTLFADLIFSYYFSNFKQKNFGENIGIFCKIKTFRIIENYFFRTLVFVRRQNLVAPFEVFKHALSSTEHIWNLRGIKLVWFYITFLHAHFCICALFPYNLRSNMYKIALVQTKIQEGQAKPGTGHVFVTSFVTVLKIINFSWVKTSNSRGEIG